MSACPPCANDTGMHPPAMPSMRVPGRCIEVADKPAVGYHAKVTIGKFQAFEQLRVAYRSEEHGFALGCNLGMGAGYDVERVDGVVKSLYGIVEACGTHQYDMSAGRDGQFVDRA